MKVIYMHVNLYDIMQGESTRRKQTNEYERTQMIELNL